MNKISIAIICYNEEKNIRELLMRLLGENTQPYEILEIAVMSSGSEDKTEDIVKGIMSMDARVKLIVQNERRGKNAAINLFLSKKDPASDIVIVLSGDVMPERGSLANLLKPFSDAKTGMAGGRPIPINDPSSFFGFAGHFIWTVHHCISLIKPKIGEMMAFRNIIKDIPENLAVDEAVIEWIIQEKGYRTAYCPNAIVYNKAPSNLRDFLKQRIRIEAGHLQLRRRYKYTISTDIIGVKLKTTLPLLVSGTHYLWKLPWLAILFVLIQYAKLIAYYDILIAKKDHSIWDVASSTKCLSGELKAL